MPINDTSQLRRILNNSNLLIKFSFEILDAIKKVKENAENFSEIDSENLRNDFKNLDVDHKGNTLNCCIYDILRQCIELIERHNDENKIAQEQLKAICHDVQSNWNDITNRKISIFDCFGDRIRQLSPIMKIYHPLQLLCIDLDLEGFLEQFIN